MMAAPTDPEERLQWLAQLKRQAMSRRAQFLAWVGPNGRTPLHSVRVFEGRGGQHAHTTDEGVTLWDEPDRQYFARFLGTDGEPGPEQPVEEDDALRWAFALGWGLEKD